MENVALDFSIIKEPLDNLCIATKNRLERDWPDTINASVLLKLAVRAQVETAINTHLTIRYLCADYPEDYSRKIEYAISCPPLLRGIVETLCNLVFLFEDIQTRGNLFLKQGYFDFIKYKKRYIDWLGGNNQYHEFMNIVTSQVDYLREKAEITGKEKRQRFPGPKQMLDEKWGNSSETQTVLKYLYEMHYDPLSSNSHLSWLGIVTRSLCLLQRNEEEKLKLVKHLKNEYNVANVILILAIISEIQKNMGFDLLPRIETLWLKLTPLTAWADELYNKRYRAMVSNIG